MTREVRTFPLHPDDRGDLLALELPDVGFDVVRVFVATGPAEPVWRGDHGVPCRELLVLLRGTVEVRVGDDVLHLTERGQAVHLEPGERVVYRLGDDHASVLVLAAAPYRPEDFG
ncbi:WxcM-like domain-containing protein [Nocardioides sp. SYSU D00038]|uniref:WxcM-like domain-containing protein n=1 Tax=Nocardioides sp. SYSU D00038 TaxID=2812554 RepID=UPI001966FE9B|nr:WxcM-like domain-containing protein [Nocardioides sp. SYSU D00038]